ncbi:hypothetical protein D3C73_980630 [compost metagenome]
MFVNGRIGSSCDDAIVPRDKKKNATIICFWDHDCVIPRKKRFIKNKVYTLTRSHHLFCFGLIHFEDIINKDSCCIDNGFTLNRENFTGVSILRDNTVNFTGAVFG